MGGGGGFSFLESTAWVKKRERSAFGCARLSCLLFAFSQGSEDNNRSLFLPSLTPSRLLPFSSLFLFFLFALFLCFGFRSDSGHWSSGASRSGFLVLLGCGETLGVGSFYECGNLNGGSR